MTRDLWTRDISEMDYEVGYGKPPRHTRFKQGETSANPNGRPRKNLAASLAEGLNKKVVITENGRRRKIPVRDHLAADQQIRNGRSARHGEEAAGRLELRKRPLAYQHEELADTPTVGSKGQEQARVRASSPGRSRCMTSETSGTDHDSNR